MQRPSELPEQLTGECLERRIKAHQGEVLKLGLRSEQAIKGIAMRLRVGACTQAVTELHGQQFESLLSKERGQFMEQWLCNG